MAEQNQQVRLADGRRLGYDTYGDPEGKPLFHFHGAPSSRKEWQIFGSDALARQLRLWVIVPDRPGLGLSDFQDGRQIGDWPADVTELADRLGLERFAVLGYSVGGPYAAACARAIPERLTRVGMVSSVGPFDAPGVTDTINPGTLRYLNLARERPWLNRISLRMMGLVARYAPQRLVRQAASILPPPDQEVMGNEKAQQGFIAMVREALRQGASGAQVEGALMVSPWGFQPSDIAIDVHLWHGEVDQNAPVAMGRYLAATIPNCHARFYPDQGHISLFYHCIEDILKTLTADQAVPNR